MKSSKTDKMVKKQKLQYKRYVKRHRFYHNSGAPYTAHLQDAFINI